MQTVDNVSGAQALLKLQAKCKQWGQILRRCGWCDEDTSTHRAAAEAVEAQVAEMAVMGLIEKHERLLKDCRNHFTRDPSTPLDRAFDYIGICLGRGPEALKHNTVALAECLAVEVTQPNVAEPYREPTFIVQLGRWGRKLTERAEQGETQADEEGLVDGEAPKQRRGQWTKTRSEREVERYLSERMEQYHRLVPLVLDGDTKAFHEFQGVFGPTAIAGRLGNDCRKENIAQTDTYKETIQPLFKKPPRAPKHWKSPEQDYSELGDTIANMRRQVGGRE